MKKLILFSSLLILFYNSALAQDDLSINTLNFSPANYNVAFIVDDIPTTVSLTTSLGSGTQSTRLMNLQFHGNMNWLDVSIGGRLNTKLFGLYRINTIEMLYAKELKLNEKNSFFAGVNFGLHFINLNQRQLNNYVNLDDPFIVDGELPQYRFTYGLGIGYVRNNRLKIGLTIPSLIKTQNDFYEHFIINAAYKFDVGEKDISLEPEVLLFGTNLSPLTLTTSIKLQLIPQFWTKLGYRTTKSTFLSFGWKRNILQMSYLYNLNHQDYAMLNPSVHNINLTFFLGS